ncbi:BTAD domain-containing putative transcriptional regulator [Actinokineospora sp.]|uniref:BTAD domain-containing putative transcriptional regulator n=1 Tax=Actinokineospora sp. TaxID=1872133 RepID=UPI0040380F78
MLFGVLGPLAVWSADGRPVRVPEAKVRALLADLLVNQGRAVSADRLVADLWGERLPGNPVNTLQTKVSQLRSALEKAEPGGRALVAFEPAGYRLDVPNDAVDVHRFRALRSRAMTTEDPQARGVLLSEAMALWRGPALADFGDEAFARTSIHRWDEERLVALEDQAETRLALGEHAMLIGDLADLVTRNPLRERLRWLQMRALYRAGRQVEALDTFRELRGRLAGELGLDPSPGLVELHQSILRQDPALATSVGQAEVLPPVISRGRARTNMVAPLTELVGRTDAVHVVDSLISRTRLVTLVGPGGVGKTRLAMETARRHTEVLEGGAWLIEFAGFDRHACPETTCPPREWVVAAVANVLGVRDDPGSAPVQTGSPVDLVDRVAEVIGGKEILLVMDNCESVIEPVATLAGQLLRAAPNLRILATSQQPLGLAGEVLWAVPPLELPGRDDALESVRRSSAVRMFAARAAASAPTFHLDADNATAVAEICRRLDGIPLALELAATRVRVLGVHELLRRLDDRFLVLASGSRDAPARQQTLRAVIDWSWDLLTATERVVLRRLAVHSEGCALDAVEAVCSGNGVQIGDVLDLLSHLVDRSLVTVSRHQVTGEPRYRLLESVAAYCVERLVDAGEFERVRMRHCDYYVALTEQAGPHLRGREQQRWLQRLDAEAANLRAALETATRHEDATLALRLVNAMAWYWFLRGRLGEARRAIRGALSIPGAGSPVLRSAAIAWQAGHSVLAGGRADETVSASTRDLDDPATHGQALWFLGHVASVVDDGPTAEHITARALAWFRALDDRWGIAACLADRASQAVTRGEFPGALRDATRAAELFGDLGDRWGQLRASFSLGALAEIRGDYGPAARLHQEGLRNAEELGLWPDASYQLSWLGRIALLTGDHAQATELHDRAEQLAAEHGVVPGQMYARIGKALSARRQGEFKVAEEHLHVVLVWHRQVDFEPGNTLVLAELGFIAEQRGDPVTARRLHLDGFDIARRVGGPRAIALATEGLAGVLALSGDHRLAARLLGAAARTRQSVGAPLPAAERGDVNRITSASKRVLGERRFAAEFDRGAILNTGEIRDLVGAECRSAIAAR